jgi:molybdopterin-guanine dinucleotide biosynthesis protein A
MENNVTNTEGISALILSGGLSTRMGTEKRLLTYHGKPQEQFLFDLLSNCLSDVYVSVNAGQQTGFPSIKDLDLGMKSPMIGILSAFAQKPDSAWLVVACDMPFVTAETIEYLLEHRNPAKYATAFENPELSFPEPLLTIYEPKIYKNLQEALQQGKKSPMKVLQSVAIEKLQVIDGKMLTNVNTPAEYVSINKNND